MPEAMALSQQFRTRKSRQSAQRDLALSPQVLVSRWITSDRSASFEPDLAEHLRSEEEKQERFR